MNTPLDNTPIPDWKCERYLLGELGEREMEHIRQQLQHDEELRARMDSMERSNHEILAHYPAGLMAQQIAEKLTADRAPASSSPRRTVHRSWQSRRRVWASAALAAVVATALLLNPSWIDEQGGDDPHGTRIKGPDAVLTLYRRTPTGSQRLENLDSAAEHDLILPHYRSDGESYGLIFSVDGRGILTRHHPTQDGPALLEFGGPHALDFAYELDDAPRWEIFVLASSKTDFSADAVIRAIEASAVIRIASLTAAEADSVLHALSLPPNVSLSTFTLIKEVGDEE